MKGINSVITFGERLRVARENAQLTLKTVAKEVGIDTSLLGKIERNERQPTKEQLRMFAAFFKLNERELLTEVLSDQFAYRIIEEQADINSLKVAEMKVKYLKSQR